MQCEIHWYLIPYSVPFPFPWFRLRIPDSGFRIPYFSAAGKLELVALFLLKTGTFGAKKLVGDFCRCYILLCWDFFSKREGQKQSNFDK